MILVALIMLERLAQIHLHSVALMTLPSIHHDIVALVPMALVEHTELLRGLPSR